MENENVSIDVIVPEYLLDDQANDDLIQEPILIQSDNDNSVDSSEPLLYESTLDYTNDLNVLNENIVQLHTSIKFGIGLIFCIVIFLLFKCSFYIFNRILGLGNC